jgi:hypothetical protein
MARSLVLDEIQGLDPEVDHQRIVFLSTRYDFAFDTTRALEFALFRTFCVPTVSSVLDRSGEFQSRAQKRYDDTDIIVSELMENGYDSDRGRAALRRMNQIHGRFDIRNEDYLYVLSTFVFEPIRWNAKFGWRPMCEQERRALFYFWRAVGKRMNIQQIPDRIEDLEQYNLEYEQARYRSVETNRRVGAATRDMFLSWFPAPLRPMARPAMYAIMDEPLIEAFGFPRPSRTLRWLVAKSLKLRARLLRLLPPRRRPVLRTEMRQRTYPRGYQIDTLGPPQAT